MNATTTQPPAPALSELRELNKGIAISAIGVIATEEQLFVMVMGTGDVDRIKNAVRSSVYWPQFVELVKAGEVKEDFAGPGIISRCVIGWAKGGA
jgi:hypothetical protein